MKLKDLRIEARLSQEELGRLLAIAEGNADSQVTAFQPRISSYETGRSEIGLTTCRLLVRVLNERLEVVGSSMRASVDEIQMSE